MAKAPAFQWYPKDCDTDENVRAMDDREFGFYMRCLNHAWLNGGLPADLNELARVIGRPKGYVEKVWARVGKCFVEDAGRFWNVKQEGQRQTVREFKDSRRDAANARWEKDRECKRNARASDVQCSASADAAAVVNVDGEVKVKEEERIERIDARARDSPKKKDAAAIPEGVVSISQEEWPEVTKAIQDPFPSTDGTFILRVVQDSIQGAISDGIDPALVTDHALARAVLKSMETDNVKRAGLLLKTVPQIIRTWGKQQ
jgi:uncharacterized protein YdaU (DUF1376 family)